VGAIDNQPDWHSIAEKFDLWLPHLAPVGEALLSALDARPGEQILDLASGTGEPALTLAHRLGASVTITGVDSAAGMVEVAREKARRECLDGIVSFHVMPAEQLGFSDHSFHRALCRFGVMLFENPLQGLREMRRVLKPGGRFALAVWSRAETMPTMHWSYQAFAPRLPEEHHPPLARVTSLGEPGVLEDLLSQAGFEDFTVEPQTFDYEFRSFDEYWDTVEASDILKQQYDALPESERSAIRDEVGRFARDFIRDDRLIIPHEYLLATGTKT
jgi:ubiquinone/menaquinone biosynthesis C-methylase UbiE